MKAQSFMTKQFISLTSDFGVQTQGVGIMQGVVLSIAPDVNVIHLMHGLPEFDITAAARTMETVRFLPIGAHVCVCDPGVGTNRKAIICETARGDYLIGPDNGVLIPATRVLGGVVRVHEISNTKYMRQPVSPIFHGRDIFSPAAAHLAIGIPIAEFGPLLDNDSLVSATYEEASQYNNKIISKIIQINRFGSIHLNISHEIWDEFSISSKNNVIVETEKYGRMELPICRTFADVQCGEYLLLKDDYGRVEIAKNMGSFVGDFPLKINDEVVIHN